MSINMYVYVHIHIFKIYIHVSGCLCESVCYLGMEHVWSLQDKLQELVLSFCREGPEDQMQVCPQCWSRHLYQESLFWLTFGFLQCSHSIARPTSFPPCSPDGQVLMVNLLSLIPGCKDYMQICLLYFFLCVTIFLPKQVCDSVCHSSALPTGDVFPEPHWTPDSIHCTVFWLYTYT